MRFKFGVVCTNEPAEYVPVTVIEYAPGGVPLLPVVVMLPPHAIWKNRPANSVLISAAAINLTFLDLRSEPKPMRVATIPISGRQSAKYSPEPEKEDIARAVAPVVFTVNVAGTPDVTELGPTEHVGASAGVLSGIFD